MEAAELLRRPATIRERCGNIFASPAHFDVRLERLPDVVERVEAVTRESYPDGSVPVHGRFRHFGDRLRELEPRLGELDGEARARALIDLVVVSVLLDAGAGASWRYVEPSTGIELSRSEGLAVASFRMFEAGAFSLRGELEATADGLQAMGDEALENGFQASDANPLVGVSGRAELMRSLGRALASRPDLFGKDGRPGGLLQHVSPDAESILGAVLDGFGSIWPSRLTLDGENLGDVWRHRKAAGTGESAGLVPFHKLSQWLTYSLIEPFELAGAPVANVEALTGLAEYRNGGLFVDAGVLEPRRPEVTSEVHPPDAEIVVEWRALTIVLLDRVARAIGRPLAEVLEGGTWQAGRRIALEKRADGSPPIRVESDGTLF